MQGISGDPDLCWRSDSIFRQCSSESQLVSSRLPSSLYAHQLLVQMDIMAVESSKNVFTHDISWPDHVRSHAIGSMFSNNDITMSN